MSDEPKEPACPADRKPHSQRIADIIKLCPVGKTAAVCVDDTPEHIAYYSYHLKRAAQIDILFEGKLGGGIYTFKITKKPASASN